MKISGFVFFFFLPFFVMAQSNNTVTADFLQSFADAFNAHDIDAIMGHMTQDCIFQASAGLDSDGEKFTGQQEVKRAFE